jgi:hypothetical protein
MFAEAFSKYGNSHSPHDEPGAFQDNLEDDHRSRTPSPGPGRKSASKSDKLLKLIDSWKSKSEPTNKKTNKSRRTVNPMIPSASVDDFSSISQIEDAKDSSGSRSARRPAPLRRSKTQVLDANSRTRRAPKSARRPHARRGSKSGTGGAELQQESLAAKAARARVQRRNVHSLQHSGKKPKSSQSTTQTPRRHQNGRRRISPSNNAARHGGTGGGVTRSRSKLSEIWSTTAPFGEAGTTSTSTSTSASASASSTARESELIAASRSEQARMRAASVSQNRRRTPTKKQDILGMLNGRDADSHQQAPLSPEFPSERLQDRNRNRRKHTRGSLERSNTMELPIAAVSDSHQSSSNRQKRRSTWDSDQALILQASLNTKTTSLLDVSNRLNAAIASSSPTAARARSRNPQLPNTAAAASQGADAVAQHTTPVARTRRADSDITMSDDLKKKAAAIRRRSELVEEQGQFWGISNNGSLKPRMSQLLTESAASIHPQGNQTAQSVDEPASYDVDSDDDSVVITSPRYSTVPKSSSAPTIAGLGRAQQNVEQAGSSYRGHAPLYAEETVRVAVAVAPKPTDASADSKLSRAKPSNSHSRSNSGSRSSGGTWSRGSNRPAQKKRDKTGKRKGKVNGKPRMTHLDLEQAHLEQSRLHIPSSVHTSSGLRSNPSSSRQLVADMDDADEPMAATEYDAILSRISDRAVQVQVRRLFYQLERKVDRAVFELEGRKLVEKVNLHEVEQRHQQKIREMDRHYSAKLSKVNSEWRSALNNLESQITQLKAANVGISIPSQQRRSSDDSRESSLLDVAAAYHSV